MKQYMHYLLLAGLVGLAISRPWRPLVHAVGIVTPMDSLRADSSNVDREDSLLINPVAITLPDVVTDSLSESFRLRTKKKGYLEDQNKLLQAENAKLDKERKRLMGENQKKQQQLLDEQAINELLEKQNGKAKSDNEHLKVSKLETELNQRANGSAQPFGKKDP